MKILVTGGAGFIGSNLCEYLLNKGYQVVAIDNFSNFYNPKIKEYNTKSFIGHKNFKLYRIDLLDTKSIKDTFDQEGKMDAIVHLAAIPGVTKSYDIPAEYVRNNIEGTINLLEAAKKYDSYNFIFASTSSVYGDEIVPFTEEMSTDKPLAPYPATKKAVEVLLYSYAKNLDFKVSILRIFNPNGKRLRPDLAIPKLVKSCLYSYEFPMYWSEEAAQKTGRDYCYVEHILEAIDHIIHHPYEYEIFNLGNSAPITLMELLKTVEKVVGKKVNAIEMPKRKGEMQVTYANIDKAKRKLGYNPTTSIEQIIEIYYKWFLEQEEWYRLLK